MGTASVNMANLLADRGHDEVEVLRAAGWSSREVLSCNLQCQQVPVCLR